MKTILILVAGVVVNLSQARATIVHWGYCTQFETMNSCQQNHTNDNDYTAYCSCPGEPPKGAPPSNHCHHGHIIDCD